MDSPARLREAQPRREDPLPNDGAIHQGGSRFGTTQVTGGWALQGNFVGLTINSTAPARPDYAGLFSHSSLGPVKAFVPRPLLHTQIREQLRGDNGNDNNAKKVLVVWGLGGAGKTQLVLNYVQQCRNDYHATFWIEAGQKESLERDFILLYKTLFRVQIGSETRTVSVEDAVLGVKSWFSSRPGSWLMVFDGADVIEKRDSAGYIDIKHFIPDAPSLHVIITSRSSTAKDMTPLAGVAVGEMEVAQAAELFYRSSQVQRDDEEVDSEVESIVRELGYLALAVILAATYVSRTPRLQSDIKAYLPEYKQR
ncbi:hypothetical protein A1O1_00941 [Capronia coronata CBS 617.96]|uniref:NB-ARC domain-containing protein n=1 Tax=Capronia coronata CBS 617.96 TaxID=1182541 RepID=W9YSD6_9EURO|nr:uncharacterized protein A1O1_00941 [Capronia coronata CBS 617.96]EXJ95817.1 hypothetical protein A1O1_00941 [Capronia coronata CBS 617.96]